MFGILATFLVECILGSFETFIANQTCPTEPVMDTPCVTPEPLASDPELEARERSPPGAMRTTTLILDSPDPIAKRSEWQPVINLTESPARCSSDARMPTMEEPVFLNMAILW